MSAVPDWPVGLVGIVGPSATSTTLKIDRVDARLRPGTSVQLLLAGTRVDNALRAPPGIFEKSGKPIVPSTSVTA
jgi:hypothetical protein